MNDNRYKDSEKMKRHVVECPRGDNIPRLGDEAEEAVMRYLLDNLPTRSVGEYRILMNYHMPVHTRGPATTTEIDLVLLNKIGVFLLEVKDWTGSIVAYDDTWVKDGHPIKGNPLLSIESKARIFKSHLFASMTGLEGIAVKGLVVLARGKNSFVNSSSYDDRSIIGIDQELLKSVNPPAFLTRSNHRKLSDEEIAQITEKLIKKHIPSGEVLIEDYRLGNQLLPGDLYKAFEAVNQNLPNRSVRIKVYQLKDVASASEKHRLKIRRDADAVSKLDTHPNILYTLNFFPDPDRSDLFYEVTELVDGERLDKLLALRKEPLSFATQLNYLEQLCSALAYAHSKGVYHRSLSPETIYITRTGIVKLADFDFAKVEGVATIAVPGQVLVDNDFTAPELISNPSNASPRSDLFSLGYLWLYLASWPERKPPYSYKDIQSLPIPLPARELMRSLLAPAPINRPQNAENVRDKLMEIKTY